MQYSLNSDFFRGLTVHDLSYSRSALDYELLSDWGKKPSGTIITRGNFLDEIQKLIVDPKPSQSDTLLIFYNAYPNNLTADSSKSNIPKEWSNAVIDLTTALCLERVQNEWSSYYRSLADTEIRRLIMIYSQPPYNVIILPQVINR